MNGAANGTGRSVHLSLEFLHHHLYLYGESLFYHKDNKEITGENTAKFTQCSSALSDACCNLKQS